MATSKFKIPVILSDCLKGCEPSSNDPLQPYLLPSFLDWASCASTCMDKVFAQDNEIPLSDQPELVAEIFNQQMQKMRLVEKKSADERLLDYKNQLRFNGSMANLMGQIRRGADAEDAIDEVVTIINESDRIDSGGEYDGQPGTLESKKGFWGRLKKKVSNFLSDAGDFLIANHEEICAGNAAILDPVSNSV
ncbi:MAG: hypothetical protein OEQ39_25180 [Gammaproteobacteria bacterium]|nr:hypothetical protein [Gammaproteobacteria bacterium]